MCNDSEIPTLPLPVLIAQLEASIIKAVLQECNGNQAKVAQRLGLQPNTLHYKLKRLGLKTPESVENDLAASG